MLPARYDDDDDIYIQNLLVTSDFFLIVVGVMQRDTLTPYLFLVCRDYAL